MLDCHNGIFFKRGAQECGDRNKPFKSSFCEPHKGMSIERIREWIYTDAILYRSGSSTSDPGTPGGPQGLLRGSKRLKHFA